MNDMCKKLPAILMVLFAAAAVYCAQTYEKNRLEIIKPMKDNEILLRPTFNSCGFYFGTDKVDSPVLEFRKKGSSKWLEALTPVHFTEDGNTTTGLVMNEYRGSIVKLEENTVYEVRFRDGDNTLKSGKFTTWKTDVPVAKTIFIDTENFKEIERDVKNYENAEKMEKLLSQLRQCRQGTLCPHGRPTLININYNEIEKRFGRR